VSPRQYTATNRGKALDPWGGRDKHEREERELRARGVRFGKLCYRDCAPYNQRNRKNMQRTENKNFNLLKIIRVRK